MLRTRQPKKLKKTKKSRVTATPKARKKVTHLVFGGTVVIPNLNLASNNNLNKVSNDILDIF